MKTTPTMTTRRRVLLACFLCALWCGAVLAAGESSAAKRSGDLLNYAQHVTRVGKEAAQQGAGTAKCAEDLLGSLGRALENVRGAAKVGEMKDALETFQKAQKTAQTFRDKANKIITTVGKANEVAEGLEREARKWVERTKNATNANEGTTAVREAASNTFKLWIKAVTESGSQLPAAMILRKNIMRAKTVTLKMAPLGITTRQKEEVVRALMEPHAVLENLTREAYKLYTSAQKFNEKIAFACKWSAHAAKTAGAFAGPHKSSAARNGKEERGGSRNTITRFNRGN